MEAIEAAEGPRITRIFFQREDAEAQSLEDWMGRWLLAYINRKEAQAGCAKPQPGGLRRGFPVEDR